MTRTAVLAEADWERLEPLLPSSDGVRGRPFRDHRQVLEGIVFRYRTGCAWRDLPAEFGPWQTVWKRHHRFCTDGTWDRILTALQAEADAAGGLDWRGQRGLLDQSGAPARRHRRPHRGSAERPHGGLDGTTRIGSPSPLTTASAAPGAGYRPRPTWPSTARDAPWPS